MLSAMVPAEERGEEASQLSKWKDWFDEISIYLRVVATNVVVFGLCRLLKAIDFAPAFVGFLEGADKLAPAAPITALVIASLRTALIEIIGHTKDVADAIKRK
jgi:hypothetical protein